MDVSDNENGSDCSDEDLNNFLEPEDLFDCKSDDEINHDRDNDNRNDTVKDEAEDIGDDVKKNIIKPKRIVRNPRVLLNVDSLKGYNGLEALKNLFQNFKFKGNDHEIDDLKKIMSILQQWMCYQLCPRYDFESCMRQIEILGKKKVLQTLLKKYRMGINDWGDNKSENDCDSHQINGEVVNKENNDFDMLLNTQTENIQVESPPHQQFPSSNDIVLTQEQLERIARNRKLAEEKRQLRINIEKKQAEVSKNQDNDENVLKDISKENNCENNN